VEGFVRRYPDRALAPVAEEHGRELRAECFEEPVETEREVEIGEHDTMTVAEVAERRALPWCEVLGEYLRWHERYRGMRMKMARGRRGTPEYESFEVPLDNSFTQEYARGEFARLKALERETCGGERPSGEYELGRFEEPATAIMTRSASGEGLAPAAHLEALVGSWTPVRRSLRYHLEDRLGLEPGEDYVWWRQGEQHPGGGYGANVGLGHEHVALFVDLSALDGGTEVVDHALRRVVEKHVEECGPAEADAHGDGAVSVSRVGEGDGEVGSAASYVAEYVGVNTDTDPLERSLDRLMWESVMWATATRKASRSNPANAAVRADRCRQEFEDPEARQSHDHGEEIVRSDRPGVEFECAECGSPWRIDQEPGTLVRARLAAEEARLLSSVVESRDSGGFNGSLSGGEAGGSARSRWESARAAASVGCEPVERECGHPEGSNRCPLCAESVGAVSASVPIPSEAGPPSDGGGVVRDGFERPAEWRAESVVVDGEEYPVEESSGGVATERVVVRGAGAIPADRLIAPDKLRDPDPPVDPTEYPPPELIEQQLAEVHRGDPVTPKEWPEDWHEQRYGGGEAVGPGDGPEGIAEAVDVLELEASPEEILEAVR
jgi:hypothetical protein